MKTQNTPHKTPIAQVIEDALASVTELPWFEGFHAGKHTDRTGKEFEFTREHLEQVVANFEPDTIPFVTGHPEADAPSYGYAKEIKLSEDDKLYLNGDNVDVQFATSVIKGNYGKRSLGLQFNKQKGWYLDHVAFLGAVAPALKLQPVGQYKFAQEQTKPTQFDFSIETQTANTIVNFLRKFKRWMAEHGNTDESNTIIDDWEIDWLQREAIREELKEQAKDSPFDYSQSHEFSTNNPAEDTTVKTFTQAELDAAIAKAENDGKASVSADFSKQIQSDKDRIAQLEKQNAAMQFSQQVEQHQAWVDTQVSAGKLFPAQAVGMAQFMAHIGTAAAVDNTESTQFEFSRGTGDKVEKVKQGPVEFMKNMIENGKKHGLMDDIDDEELGDKTAQFSSADDLNTAALEYQKVHDVTYSVAIDKVIAGAK